MRTYERELLGDTLVVNKLFSLLNYVLRPLKEYDTVISPYAGDAGDVCLPSGQLTAANYLSYSRLRCCGAWILILSIKIVSY